MIRSQNDTFELDISTQSLILQWGSSRFLVSVYLHSKFGHLWVFLKKLKVVWLAHLGLHGASNVADEHDMFHIGNQWSLLEGW
jgi:hypothetical protein